MICIFCGGSIKTVPAGISKKPGKNFGKPYNAFYACENPACGKTAPVPTQTPVFTPEQKFMAPLEKESEREYWEKKGLAQARTKVAEAYIRAGVNFLDAIDKGAWMTWIEKGE